MADALVTVMLEQLEFYLRQEAMVNARDQLREFVFTLKLVQAVLADAESKQLQSTAVKFWLQDLKDVVYTADDMVDEWITKGLLLSQRNRKRSSISRKVRALLLSPVKNVYDRHDIGQWVKIIRDRLDEIASERSKFLLTTSYDPIVRLDLSSAKKEEEMIGREKEEASVLDVLLNESSDQGIRVVAIVGKGGMGKTTLARSVFHNIRVEESFELKMWVCVSQRFDLIVIAKEIMEQVQGIVTDSSELEVVWMGLCRSVTGRRFLLVLDDVWLEDSNLWMPLWNSLQKGASGSGIIITTRVKEVAMIMGCSNMVDLHPLSEEECWDLFQKLALKDKTEDVGMFESIGREIVSKCYGHPLAIQTLGNLLHSKDTVEDWKDILESYLWRSDNNIPLKTALSMSYDSLASISKQCFQYCAIFPKDTKISKEDLVKLWMAQGFLGSREVRELEETGREQFDQLVRHSFLGGPEEDGNYNMHPLIHDFAQSLTHSECSCMEMNVTELRIGVRHVCTRNFEDASLYKAKNLRTLVRPIGCMDLTRVPVELFNKLTCLRTLDLSRSGLNELSSEVENLLHLRYLNLSGTHLLELPETICNLLNLQTLKLNECKKLRKLPQGVGKLSHLRHLEILETDALSYLPETILELSLLKTLNKFIVSRVGVGCHIGDLTSLNDLEGKLELKGLKEITDRSEAAKAELNKKKGIKELTFNFEVMEGRETGRRMEGILERLEPHNQLTGLTISYFSGSQFPHWTGSSLNYVVTMKLYKCGYCTELPGLGKLPGLEYLEVDGLSSVRYIRHEFYGLMPGSSSCTGDQMMVFPRLKKLVLKNMETWEEWELPISTGTKILPFLSELALDECPVLNALPCLGMLESLEFLDICNLPSVKRFGLESLKVLPKTDDDVHSEGILFSSIKWFGLAFLMFPRKGNMNDEKSAEQVIRFPKLKSLSFRGMKELEQWEEPCLPQSLEKLILQGDVGAFSESLPIKNDSLVTSFSIIESLCLSLPKGFERLNAVEKLKFSQCHSLDFALEELQKFTRLRYLEINECPILKGRFQGEDWRTILSAVFRIIVDDLNLTYGN